MPQSADSLPQSAGFANHSFPTGAASSSAILVGVGGNRRGADARGIRAGLQRALDLFPACGIEILARSSWYRSEPVGDIPQECYVNGVVRIASLLPPLRLLGALQRIESAFARNRKGEVRWGARTLDLDLLSHGDLVHAPRSRLGRLILPHPRMDRRAFVLVPLAEVLPTWRHPHCGRSVSDLLSSLPEREILSLERIREQGKTPEKWWEKK